MTLVLPVHPLTPDAEPIARAAACLRAGGLVAFPTETVYGLGAHAMDAAAVARVFVAKDRPATDPLIVHVADVSQLGQVVSGVPGVVLDELAARFWPGPLTLVLPRGAAVPPAVSAGGATVAVRIPSHPVAQALLRAAAIPIAAPSANLFSRPSPTRAEHVMEDLGGRIDMVLDGGATLLGVESTVLDLTVSPPCVLRPGAVTLEMLRAVIPDVIALSVSADPRGTTAGLRSPGLLSKHYAPRAPLTVYEGEPAARRSRMLADVHALIADGRRVGALVCTEDADAFRVAGVQSVVVLGAAGDLPAMAARLYAALREIDAAGIEVILAGGLPRDDGLAAALRDRLRRAAAGRVIVCETTRPN